MNNKNVICQNLIEAADVIVIYGASLGLSDEKWWRMIGARMSTDKYPLLIYLPYDDKKNLYAEPNRLRRWTRDYVANIKNKFDIKLEDKVMFLNEASDKLNNNQMRKLLFKDRIRLRKDFKEIRHDCNVNVRSFLGQNEFRRMSFHIVLLYSITLPSHILNDSKDYKNILEVSRSTVETKSDEIIGKITRSILKKIDSVT